MVAGSCVFFAFVLSIPGEHDGFPLAEPFAASVFQRTELQASHKLCSCHVVDVCWPCLFLFSSLHLHLHWAVRLIRLLMFVRLCLCSLFLIFFLSRQNCVRKVRPFLFQYDYDFLTWDLFYSLHFFFNSSFSPLISFSELSPILFYEMRMDGECPLCVCETATLGSSSPEGK